MEQAGDRCEVRIATRRSRILGDGIKGGGGLKSDVYVMIRCCWAVARVLRRGLTRCQASECRMITAFGLQLKARDKVGLGNAGVG